MLKTPFLTLILTSVAAATLASAAPAQTVTASIDAFKTFPPINKLVYGQFLEHIGNLVNSGLWAEMLDDRKFFTAIPAPPPANNGGRFGRAALRRWMVVGPDSMLTICLSVHTVTMSLPDKPESLLKTILERKRDARRAFGREDAIPPPPKAGVSGTNL